MSVQVGWRKSANESRSHSGHRRSTKFTSFATAFAVSTHDVLWGSMSIASAPNPTTTLVWCSPAWGRASSSKTPRSRRSSVMARIRWTRQQHLRGKPRAILHHTRGGSVAPRSPSYSRRVGSLPQEFLRPINRALSPIRIVGQRSARRSSPRYCPPHATDIRPPSQAPCTLGGTSLCTSGSEVTWTAGAFEPSFPSSSSPRLSPMTYC